MPFIAATSLADFPQHASHLLLRWKWPIGLLLVLSIFWPYVYCLSAVVYNYAFWVLFSGTVSIAAPITVPEFYADNGIEPPVPRLLHQTWKDGSVPEQWQAASESCKTLHPDYAYKLWTDADAEHLIASRFPWFLDTYRSYPHNIQRADAMRYFILYEYGGIYLDLDIKCLKSLDFLRYFNFTAPKTYPVGLSNDLLVSRPKDPFAQRLTENLKTWNMWFWFKYATVMFSTGPMFVTVQYTLYGDKDGVTMLPPDIYGKYQKGPAAYMEHLHGSSWHGNDAKVVFWFEHYWLQLVLLGSSAALLLAYWLYRQYFSLKPAATPMLWKKLSSDLQ